jgi:hypothetical protein
MSELQYPAPTRGQQDEKVTQAADVDLLIRRQLKEDRSELRAQVIRPLQKQGQLTGYVPKTFDMSDIPAGLDGEVELVGGHLTPALEHFGCREAVKRIVELDRLEPVGEVPQLLPGREPGRIEYALAPVPVHVP